MIELVSRPEARPEMETGEAEVALTESEDISYLCLGSGECTRRRFGGDFNRL